MRKQLALIGYAHVAAGAVYLVCAALALFGAVQGVLFVSRAVGYVLTLALAVLGLGSLAGGYGLLRTCRWARVLLLAVGVLNLINVPIGTLLGAYTLWVLWKDEAAAELARGGPLWPDAHGSSR